jgi:phosphohistidine phosphatase
MKTLYIVRHAKSSWSHPDLPDHDRPLLEKGKKRTRKIINFMKEEGVKIDFIISSSATRASETALYFAKGLNYDPREIKADPALYHANAEEIFNQFNDLSDKYSNVMIVGHNPALTNFVNCFIQPPIDWLPTSGVISIQFQMDKWEEIRKSKFKVEFVIFPKLL